MLMNDYLNNDIVKRHAGSELGNMSLDNKIGFGIGAGIVGIGLTAIGINKLYNYIRNRK
jgi:Na+/melibiose symporter-like transporter